MDAVVGAELEGDARVGLPFGAEELGALFGGELHQGAAIGGEHLVMFRGVGQARARAAQVFVRDRSEDHEAYLARRTGFLDELHQLGDFALEAGRRVFGAVTGRVGVEGGVVLAVGEFLERGGHAVADDRDGRLHDRELLLELLRSFGDRVEAGARGAERRITGVAEVTHGELLAREFAAHLGLDVTVVVFAFDQHVADQEDAITVIERELALVGGMGARREGDDGAKCQKDGEAGHVRIGKAFRAMARRLSTPEG